MINKSLTVVAVAIDFAGCAEETSRPFGHAVGTLTVEGTDYYSVVIFEAREDGTHVVGGFVSDETLGKVTIGPDNSQNAPLQIISDAGILIYDGKKQTIENDGLLVWIIDGKMYEQKLAGFPLEQELKRPKEIPRNPDAGHSD